MDQEKYTTQKVYQKYIPEKHLYFIFGKINYDLGLFLYL